jgi:hypothetical protein
MFFLKNPFVLYLALLLLAIKKGAKILFFALVAIGFISAVFISVFSFFGLIFNKGFLI